ncbi:filaggrin-2-like [Mya arenaria]|uniref:filaggrin-2-like n=1 Tax=Mya arenaria TaxID=6604 RepID=UPI0022DFAFF8|nr:filaggrin-2-like [Mya arenaria]
MQYGADVSAYGNVDYTPSDEMYTENQPARTERPKTGHGRRSARQEMPARPMSRRARPDTNTEESVGRPISRAGFSPDSAYRYSHDEYSRQISSDSEKQIPNSPCESPEILYRDDEYFNNQKALYGHNQEGHSPVDRLIVSPSAPSDLMKKSSKKARKSPHVYSSRSPQGYSQSPQNYGQSPRAYKQSPQHEQPMHRPSSREYMSVSPLHRDEAQLNDNDIHHQQPRSRHPSQSDNMEMQEGDTYQQSFSASPQYRDNPYQENQYHHHESPMQARNSPYQEGSYYHHDSPVQARDSPYYGSSPGQHQGHGHSHGYSGSPEGHSRPPPAPRPKSARPKTGRRKSARARQHHHARYEDQETSPPQQCDTSHILNAGDPYGRPASSLSPYRPLPAIGVVTPRDDPADNDHGHMTPESKNRSSHHVGSEHVTVTNQKLSEMNTDNYSYHPADQNEDVFSAEDIHGAENDALGPITDQGIPGVDMLSNLPQHLSEEIYQSSLANYETNIGDIGGVSEEERSNSEIIKGGEVSVRTAADNFEHLSMSVMKPLDFLHEIPDEPSSDEPRLLLAVKLPDGKRIQRHFRPNETLDTVIKFAENTNLVKYEDMQLICNATHTQFSDPSVRISDTHIKDRTVLYLQEKE